MSPPVVFPLPGNEALAQRFATVHDADLGVGAYHRFPDGETLVRFDSPLENREVILIGTLHNPDPLMAPLLFAADTARELGARSVGLVAPYLAYMRQDQRFHAGEAVTAPIFARFLSACVDWLVTMDPHLHRIARLDDIYTIPTAVAHAWQPIAGWIRENVEAPLVIGPDEESRQWVSNVAASLDAPLIILEKQRRGDRDVEVSVPDAEAYRHRTPVLVDDIVSTAHTMIEAAKQCERQGLPKPWCVGVHPVFAPESYAALMDAPIAGFVSCNTIPHESNGMDVTPFLSAEVRGVMGTS